MRMQKIAKAVITSSAAFALAVMPAFAAVQDTSVINSGDHAHVSNSASDNSNVTVSNNNSAKVSQNVNASANTGGNEASNNISLGGAGASITTGPAGVDTHLTVEANKNTTAVGGLSAGAVNLTDIVNTGDKAHINTDASTNNSVAVSNSNYAGVKQNAWEKANTGYNDANNNIGGGTINTSGAGVGTSFGVAVNSNETAVGGYGAGALGTGSLLNQSSLTNTGDYAHVNSSASNNNAVAVSNDNSAWISQFVHAKSNTGDNDAKNNIGGGSIYTSGAGVSTVANVAANSNETGVAGWWGGLSLGGNFNDTVNTGDKLKSHSDVSNNTSFSVANTNDVWSHQTTWEHSSSGWNDANNNIGHSGILTSGAGVGTGLGFQANANSTVIGWLGGVLGLLAF